MVDQISNETIAKRRRTAGVAAMTEEEVISKIVATPGIRGYVFDGGQSVNRRLLAKMAAEGKIIRKIPRTGRGYELYLPGQESP